MALPWPHSAPTLPRPVPALTRARLVENAGEMVRTRPVLARLAALATSPVTALIVMLAGLALLFVAPLIGLPFVALVVLPAVIYHLRAERRGDLLRSSRA